MKFEYKEVMLKVNGGVPDKKNINLLNDLGKEGWELISVATANAPIAFTSVPVTKTLIAYFKKEIK
ncbi:MAG: DUF4177 domain-containing protein [archaeon]